MSNRDIRLTRITLDHFAAGIRKVDPEKSPRSFVLEQSSNRNASEAAVILHFRSAVAK
jgi:hypothetical protein